MVEIFVLSLFVVWCVAVFVFLRRMAARGKKSAAQPDPARKGMDELIEEVEKSYSQHDSKS